MKVKCKARLLKSQQEEDVYVSHVTHTCFAALDPFLNWNGGLDGSSNQYFCFSRGLCWEL